MPCHCDEGQNNISNHELAVILSSGRNAVSIHPPNSRDFRHASHLSSRNLCENRCHERKELLNERPSKPPEANGHEEREKKYPDTFLAHCLGLEWQHNDQLSSDKHFLLD
jgi:hypothetical protein